MTDQSRPSRTATDDSRAVEHVLGRPLGQSWPPDALPPGGRVTVVRDPEWDGPWPVEFLGTIDAMGAPEPNGHARALDGELLYWVVFDAPQYDSAGGRALSQGPDLGPAPEAGAGRRTDALGPCPDPAPGARRPG
ncbi:ferrous iron transport protein A [Streptomyces yangpuensis]|uniref:ferrous iron transport protein A n=1 Tax=Streptomyces yangpuensis TaxID=1648182 RepID=UPI00364B02A0